MHNIADGLLVHMLLLLLIVSRIAGLSQCKGHANSMQAGRSCIARLSLAQPGDRVGHREASPGHTRRGQVTGESVMQRHCC